VFNQFLYEPTALVPEDFQRPGSLRCKPYRRLVAPSIDAPHSVKAISFIGRIVTVGD
jgi:hypothetical protein